MNWFKRQFEETPQLQPLPQQENTASEMFVLVDLVNDDGDKVPTIEPISLMDCLSIYTSYMDTTTMPKTPSNTPTDTPKSTSAIIYDNKHALWETPPTELDILAGLTNVSSFSSLVFTPPLSDAVEDIDHPYYNGGIGVQPPPVNQPPTYCTSLTPMLLHGGIPITFMVMAQFGLTTMKKN